MSSVMSMVSMTPADLSTISSCHGEDVSVTLKVVVVSEMSPLAVTLFPDQLVTVPPYTSCAIVRWMSTVVVVVLDILPWVNWGVTDCAEAGAASSSRSRSFFIPFSHV